MKRIVGKKVDREISFDASAESLLRGMEFNDEIHRTFKTKDNGVLKGLYRFKSHAEANRHKDECVAAQMARLALKMIEARKIREEVYGKRY